MSEPSDYAARDAPADFSEFMAAIDGATTSQGGIMVDADLYEDFFGTAPAGKGATQSFINALPRPPSSQTHDRNASCPVCLQTLDAITTEEEYAQASESYFGDLEALGLRELPCSAKHVICARCARQWLPLNNSCPMCRAVVDPAGGHSDVADTIERQRETERMLGLFHALFGRREEPAKPKDDRGKESFAGMYS